MTLSFKSIKFKILFPIIIIMIVSYVVFYFILENFEEKFTEHQVVQQGKNITDSIVNSLEGINSKSLLRRIIKNNSLDRNVSNILLLDTEKRVYLGSQNDFEDLTLSQVNIKYNNTISKLLNDVEKNKSTEYYYNEEDHDIVIASKVYLNLQQIDQRHMESLFLVLHIDGSSYYDEVDVATTNIMLITLFVIACILAIILFLIINYVLRPMNALNRIIKGYGSNNNFRPADKEYLKLSSDEFKNLGDLYVEQFQEINQANQKLKVATEAKQLFLAHMSHEIRTPLNGIIGVTEMLEDTKLDGTQKHMLAVISRSGQTLLNIVNDILDLSKIEAGKLSIIDTEFSINVLLDDLNSMFMPIAAQKGIDLILEKGFDSEVIIHSDRMRIQQVLINLINNAIKFTERGSVTIRVSEEKNNPELFKFKIVDTGIGMNSDQLFRLFKPFEQTDNSISRKYGGTGLGLVICKKIIELMNGEIHVESKPSIGTTFIVQLRCRVIKRQALSEDKMYEQIKMPEINIREQVLLVDDNEINRMVARSFLNKFCPNLYEAVDGRDAVNQYENKRPYIIFMDLQMPEVDGYSATLQIREYEKANNLRPAIIIALTSHALNEEKEKALQNGFDYYLTKPLKKSTLYQLFYDIDLKK